MNTSNDLRKYLEMMRNAKKGITYIPPVKDDDKLNKDLSMREMLAITRKKTLLNEEVSDTTSFDQKEEEDKMTKFFADDNLTFDFDKLKIYENGVWFGGTINGILEFIYKVSNDEQLSGVEINQLEGFDSNSEGNKKIVEKIEGYYKTSFTPYWIKAILQQ